MHHKYFDPSLIELMDEIHTHWPHIVHLCSVQPDTDFYVQIQEVAAAAGVILDGEYNDKDIYEVCRKLTKRLASMRTLVISSTDSISTK